MSAMQRFCRWLIGHPGLTLFVQLLLTGMFVWQFQNLRFDTSPSTLILAGSPEDQYYRKVTKVFGSDQVVLIGITGADMLQATQLRTIRDMTGELQRIPGVKSVLSLTNVTDVRSGEDEVVVSPLIPEDLQTFDREALRKRLSMNPFYSRNLISADGRTCSIVVFLEDSDDLNSLVQVRSVTRKVNAVAEAMRGTNRIFLGGLPQMELQGTENMIRDLWVFTPVTLSLVVTILLITFHCLRGILLPLGVIGVT